MGFSCLFNNYYRAKDFFLENSGDLGVPPQGRSRALPPIFFPGRKKDFRSIPNAEGKINIWVRYPRFKRRGIGELFQVVNQPFAEDPRLLPGQLDVKMLPCIIHIGGKQKNGLLRELVFRIRILRIPAYG